MTTMATRPKPAPAVRVFHADDPALSDSLQGINHAAKLKYPRIDINMLPGASGRNYGVHWPKPMEHGWRDRAGEMARDTFIWDMSDEEVGRLWYPKDPRLSVSTMAALLTRCAEVGVSAEVEPKGATAYRYQFPWERLQRAQELTGAVAVVKSLTIFKQWTFALEQAYDHGFTTMMLPRGTRIFRRERWATVEQVRGTVVKWYGPVPQARERRAV